MERNNEEKKTNLAVQDVVIAVALDAHLNVGGITRGDLRLGHQEGRANLALQQRVEPLSLLCLTAVLGNDLHVASVGGGAVDRLGSCSALAQVLGHEPVLEIAEASALLEVRLGQEHVP